MEWGDKLPLLRYFAIYKCTEESPDQFGPSRQIARQAWERDNCAYNIFHTRDADMAVSERVTFPSLHDDPVVPGTGGRKFEFPDYNPYHDYVIYQGPSAGEVLKVLAEKIVLKSEYHKVY